jgi:hypothetical protein
MASYTEKRHRSAHCEANKKTSGGKIMIKLLLIFCFVVACNFWISAQEPLSEDYEMDEAIIIYVDIGEHKPAIGAGNDTLATVAKKALAGLNHILNKMKELFLK